MLELKYGIDVKLKIASELVTILTFEASVDIDISAPTLTVTENVVVVVCVSKTTLDRVQPSAVVKEAGS
jgi:hypothetical protein